MNIILILLIIVVIIICYDMYELDKKISGVENEVKKMKIEAEGTLIPTSVSGISMNYA